MGNLIEQQLLLGDIGREAHEEPDPAIRTSRAAKIVRKPWGWERWLAEEGAPFGFKLIHIRGGQRTSLQIHERKHESNLVLRGEGYMYAAKPTDAELAELAVGPGDILEVPPGLIHRIRAGTDMTIVEVSTPELDDVIRLEDDTNRGSGRVESEHGPVAG